MVAHLTYPLHIFITALVEWVRWRQSFGRTVNLNKKVTVGIAAAAWVVSVLINCWLFWDLNFDWLLLFQLFVYALECAGMRGLLYDPVLNLLMGRKIDNDSYTTNSKFDAKEQKGGISFWAQRTIYAGVALIFTILFELI